jgi:transcriptional regulator with XRE-family HTH domain
MSWLQQDLPDRFGPVLRRLREQQRWSQEHLAHKAEINRSYLGEVERGSAVPSLATMSKLASALDMRLSNLLAICEQDTAG